MPKVSGLPQSYIDRLTKPTYLVEFELYHCKLVPNGLTLA
jgi:hypothetical protein